MALTLDDKKYITDLVKEEVGSVRDELKEDTQQMNSRVEALWGLMRGDNGDGIITQFRLVQQTLKALECSVKSLVDRTDITKTNLQQCQLSNLPRIQQSIDGNTRIEKRLEEIVVNLDKQRQEDKQDYEKKTKEYGSWAWFKEKRFDPILMAALCYIVVEVIKYFAFYR